MRAGGGIAQDGPMTSPATISTGLALALSATALAVPAVSAASIHQASFNVSVSGSQVTNWAERTHQTGGDCKGRTFERGGGHETVTFASERKSRFSALGTGRLVTLSPAGRFARFGIFAPGKTERDGLYVYSKDSNGSCATAETSYIQDYDCDTLTRHFQVSLVYDGKRLGLQVGSGVAPSDSVFNSCPIQNSADVTADGISEITAPFPARELFDRSLGKQIVLGDTQFPVYRANAWSTSRTTVKWKVIFTRVR